MSTYERGDNSQLPLIPGSDGWGDAADDASNRPFPGLLTKYTDGHYYAGADKIEVPLGMKLRACACAHYWELWPPGEGKPDRSKRVMRQPGRRLPERSELEPAYDNESEWDVAFGQSQDPWQNTRAVLFEDMETGQQYSFVTTSAGGHSAVIDLGDAIGRMRRVHHDADPIIELRSGIMPTKEFGKVAKPVFKVDTWQTSSGKPIVERKLAPQEVKEAKKIVDQREMDDDIPF
jgi:hypothetical protein